MIEFVIKDRRMRLHPDGVMYARAINSRYGTETKKEIWREIKFGDNNNGYMMCWITMKRCQHTFLKHRLVWYAHHQDWDIFDVSTDNCIDHINRNRTDNSIANLRKLTHAENQYNKEAKGYTWEESNNKWKAQISVKSKTIFLGRFVKEEDARKAYEDAKKKYHIII
jgi:hypothetical protein